ncbi:exopolysaccharide biosynthesis protein [Halomonas marinisediminis]|uniref:Exopolysaccharide biosynthesis protein n=1 Tax=Halomonas marinisediminis TaxID=2546095 RepID=A0ABY2D8H3_9GAMM|nr:exopolysaccharide biosynthesis protein [Halomonas marinisediminis]TDB04230.1 exopolysaccharide biosynthesis protein [Halomonas marinisediminis]
MDAERGPTSLSGLLARVRQAGQHEGSISLGAILETVGRRSFAPFLLLAGLITLAPLVGDIPGMPTLMASLVLLAGGQLLLGRRRIWLPRWLLERRISRERFHRLLGWLEHPAGWTDRLLHQRLTALTRPPAHVVVAVVCLVIALAMPPMEFIPFSANGAGLALTLFGLALLADDGLFALAGYLLTGGTLAVVVFSLT